jgi:Phosphotransferase enzyme family
VRIEQYAFVPARDGVFAIDGALPSVVDGWELAALQRLLPPTRYLRIAAHVSLGSEHVLRLRVFEPVDAAGAPPAEIAVPEPLRAAFDRCLAELDGAPIPAGRAPWSRAGWHEQVEAWAGMPLEQVRVWPLSAVLRNGDTWFKAVFPLFHHEPAVTEAIGMPRVLRSDHERGWMLMEQARGAEAENHHTAMRAIAAVHRAWVARVDEALALGAPDRRAPSVLPATLVHGDFHPWNVIGTTIIDWSDAAIANPLHDVNHYLLNVDESLRGPLIETYAEAWPGVEVRAAADACEAETYEYIARSYAQITAALPSDERWWFADEEARWLARASDVRAGKRPSRDS